MNTVQRMTMLLACILIAPACAAPAAETPRPTPVPATVAAAASPTVAAPAPTLAPTPAPASPTPLPTVAPTATSRPTAVPTPVAYRYRFSAHSVSASSDGTTWQERPARFSETIVSLVSPAAAPSTVYILTTVPLSTSTNLRPDFAYTIQASRDAGQTWQAGASGRIGGCYQTAAELQLPRGAAPDTVVIVGTQCADNPSDSRGLGKAARLSTDGGRTFAWSASGDGIQFAQTRDGLLRFMPGSAAAERLALSGDLGATWQARTVPALEIGFPSSYPQLDVDSADAAVVRLREQYGARRVWESRDSGRTWAVAP